MKYTKEGVELVECSACRKDEIMSKAGKFRENLYCGECYMKRLDEGIRNFQIEFKRFRNGKKGFLSRNDIMEAPRLSNYIN